MKSTFFSRTLAAVLVGVCIWGASVAAASESRTWTSRTGNTIEAVYERVWQDTVYLKGADGGAIRIGVKDLSDADQQHLRQLSQPQLIRGGAAVSGGGDVPAKIKELFGDTLVNAKRAKVPVSALAGKTIAIYFSAQWCPPCRAFTPSLVKFHEEMTAAGKPFEIVFVSSDRDQNGMYGYMRDYKMPWLAVPHGSKEQKALGGTFGVRSIPALVVIDSEGKTVSANARGDVGQGVAAFDKWAGK